MPRILIAGCGYVGQAAAELFCSAGGTVEGWVRSADSTAALATKPYAVRSVDISQRNDVAEHARSFDAVVHCASSRGGDAKAYRQIYLDGLHNLLETFPRSKLLFTSSTSVYAQSDGSWVTEESGTAPTRETSRVLLEAEELVLKHAGIVARLAGIYGPGRSALLSKFLAGTAIIDRENDRFINHVHRNDIASALLLLLTKTRQAAGIYNVADDEPILQSECYRWLAGKLNRPMPSIGNLSETRKRGNSNKRVSNAKLHGFGWKPQYPTFADAMEKSILPSFAESTRGLSC